MHPTGALDEHGNENRGVVARATNDIVTSSGDDSEGVDLTRCVRRDSLSRNSQVQELERGAIVLSRSFKKIAPARQDLMIKDILGRPTRPATALEDASAKRWILSVSTESLNGESPQAWAARRKNNLLVLHIGDGVGLFHDAILCTGSLQKIFPESSLPKNRSKQTASLRRVSICATQGE